MLGFGYFGELKLISRENALFFGFVAFFMLYGYIYVKYLYRQPNRDNSLIYWAFRVLGSIWCGVCDEDDETRNIVYNVLDLFSKCFVGIFFLGLLY